MSKSRPKPSFSSKFINVKADGQINLGALLSNTGQTMRMESMSVSLLVQSPKRWSFKSDFINVYFDDNLILKCDDVSMMKIAENETHSKFDRKLFNNLDTVQNSLVATEIESVRVVFPYEYNFAETFNERLITITKWLKQLHGSKTKTRSNALAADMLIRINSIAMEVNDDPFEVQLRDNYELLEDEYKEIVVRSQMLGEKIEQLRRTNLMMSSDRHNELHAALNKKNAEIYIKRHKQMCLMSPRGRPLFSVTADGIDIKVAADSSMNGDAKVIDIMKYKLNRESPLSDDVKFTTLWCRKIIGNFSGLKCNLRDFPKPMFDVRSLSFGGTLLGAEQEAKSRARRTCVIDVGPGIESLTIQRSMSTLKFYHDLNLKVDSIEWTHGACWEPVLQQVNIAFQSIIRPSVDPSPPLSWWDRMRLLFHGPLRISSRNLSLFFHASLNPYNSTELVEVCFTTSFIEWLTGKITVTGTLDVLVHTASKYDECRVIHLPDVKIDISLYWVCLSNQYDHHSVMSCAVDKLPEYSSNQIHDSYRAFRSENLNVMISLETVDKPVTVFNGSDGESLANDDDIPAILLFSSTLRWLENQKHIFAGMARLTRRGKLFDNVKPRKQPFSRVFKNIRVTVCLHRFKICYWSSFSKSYGCEIIGGHLTHSAEHVLTLVPFEDGLIHRPRPEWCIKYMNSELCDVDIWLCNNEKNILNLDDRSSLIDLDFNERQYFLSFTTMSYNREAEEKVKQNVGETEDKEKTPVHRLIVHNLKGSWTKYNRNIAFAMFDLYTKAQQLRRNLSADALKGFKVEGQAVHGSPSSPSRGTQLAPPSSPSSTMNRGHAASMLQMLITESENSTSSVVVDISDSEIGNEETKLRGISACLDDDIVQKSWLIELINSQVILRGCETPGYVIASAAKTQILQTIHRPVWKERTLCSKTTWVGSVECMQYYATVDPASDPQNDDFTWLSLENIEERNSMTVRDLPDLVGYGHSVGGVVSSTVGSCDAQANASPTSSTSSTTVQLQRIISRCGCKFFYVNYAEDIDLDELDEVPPLPENDDLGLLEPWDKEMAVDSFTLTHHDLEIYTNSQQFAMIIDLVNNLLLYVEPHKKQAYENLQAMRFRFQLSSLEEQRDPIFEQKDRLRTLCQELKQFERDLYAMHKTESGKADDEALTGDIQQMEQDTEDCKDKISQASDELAMMISCYKELQISADKLKQREALEAQENGQGGVTPMAHVIRRIEICFKHASWTITDSDGQLGLSDLELNNFLYTKIAKSDDSVDHTLELGYIKATNLLPNPVYKNVLMPTELKPNIPLDRHRALRIFCRERAPVAGISVKEHLEVNVVPLTIGVTYAFFKKMLKFFFPGQDEVKSSGTATNASSKKHQQNSIASATSKGDDIEKMRLRAEKNQTFVFIKIPEVPVRVSYKGNKGKNITDVNDFKLIIPTIEYHNQTWTWLDLLMAIKNESKHRLLSQAVKQKLLFKPRSTSIGETESSGGHSREHGKTGEDDNDEETKMRLLLGVAALQTTDPPTASAKTDKRSRMISLFKRSK